ncbi:Glycine cleavage system transcriptional activator [Achromobacter aegrifaciens]|uniref:LysR substrate-binding domain-containing protein n=1 Tax=Achromobacter aegrifaciens TaxID=1287736 RepID=UPI001464F606|nr:LysR substrate-binding domain-containing protein [Achromobacter aegrifaciens]CAB3841352.1 Glycine cleavage system transcriptional activator [Achromobacter aegrifaciens]
MAGQSLPPLKALRVFEAAARLRSFTAAADELSITHSAVSQQIRILEEYVGQPLFAREARGVALLPCAQAYFPEIQASLERIAAATAKLKSPAYGGVLRVCATPSLTMKWLIPRLSAFQARHPGVDVQLTTQGRSFLDRGGDTGSDVLIRHGYMAHSDLACVHCLDDFHVPVASPRFIERNRLAAPADCLGHPLLKIAGGMDHWPRWFALAKVDVPAQLPGPVFDHQFLCMQAAMNDLGIALAPWCLLEDDIRADRLRPLFDGPQLPNAGIHALYRQDGPAAASALLFIEWLREQGRDPSPTA